jgi:hypothetical protein
MDEYEHISFEYGLKDALMNIIEEEAIKLGPSVQDHGRFISN